MQYLSNLHSLPKHAPRRRQNPPDRIKKRPRDSSRPSGCRVGFEPTTLGTTIRCSDQLSYMHHFPCQERSSRTGLQRYNKISLFAKPDPQTRFRSLRPAIKPIDIDFTKVDTVFVGFPIWWHEEPAVIRTFLDNYGEQLRDKVIFPFCTSYESPMSEADATLKKGYSSLKIRKGLRLPAKAEEIKKWIKQ